MTTLALNFSEYVQERLAAYWQEKLAAYWPLAVRIIFGAFIGSLVLLLVLTYADVPIVGGV
jgi:hypothetical protein